MAQVALTNLPYASVVKPGSFGVRSLTIRTPVTPISDAEYAGAKHLMETLDGNGAALLTLVDAWRKSFIDWRSSDGMVYRARSTSFAHHRRSRQSCGELELETDEW